MVVTSIATQMEIHTQCNLHRVIPFTLGLVYAGLFLSQLGNMPEGAGFGSLNEISAMFSNPYALAAGWIHYLAFDLFVGAWEGF